MFVDRAIQSPNYSPRGQQKISMIVLHATAGTARSALAWLTNPAARQAILRPERLPLERRAGPILGSAAVRSHIADFDDVGVVGVRKDVRRRGGVGNRAACVDGRHDDGVSATRQPRSPRH